ncbi:MAG: ATP phosphoribosyltransferase regulatory subunit, partial [Chloroflexota bacterium]
MTPSIQPVKRLPNMQDLSEKQIRARQHVAKKLLGNLSLRGYEQVETPILEQSELYIRKSGGGLSARLYDFNEPGGFDVSLRPEITAAVLRIAIEDRASSKTTRLMYEGPVFRYAAPDDLEGRSTRQFNQLGAELIGPNAPEADGEVIAASLEGLRDVGIDSAYVVIGHVGIILD